MDSIPVEVVGNIFSHVAAARDVVVASTVCKKWRDAAQRHLRCLRFSTTDWAAFASGELSTKEIEVIITQTVLQTSCLRDLSICIGSGHEFSAAPVIAWLMYTKETLQSLTYMIDSDPSVNILDRCGRHKLESLELGDVTISKIDTGIHKFPLLNTLLLKRVMISSLDLNLVLSACPRLTSFSLINCDPSVSDGTPTLELTSPSLRSITFEDLNLDSVHVIVDTANLCELFVRYCTFEHLELLNRKGIHVLKMAHSNIFQLDIGEGAEELEILDISGFTLTWSKLHPMLLRASKLKHLRLWASPEVDENVLDMETLASCFPNLNRLALCYELPENMSNIITGTSEMKNVTLLEVGSDVVNEVYALWIKSLVERCPSLRRLIIGGRLSEASDPEDYHRISIFTGAILDLMRKYIHVQTEFKYF